MSEPEKVFLKAAFLLSMKIIQEIKSFFEDIQKPENQPAAMLAWVMALISWALVISH